MNLLSALALTLLWASPARVHVYDSVVDVSVKKSGAGTPGPSGPTREALATLTRYAVCRALPDGTLRWASDLRATRKEDAWVLSWPNSRAGLARKAAVQAHWTRPGSSALPAGLEVVEFENPSSLRVTWGKNPGALLFMLCHPNAFVPSADAAYLPSSRGYRANERAAWGQPFFAEMVVRERTEKDARVALAAGRTDLVLGLPGEEKRSMRFGTSLVATPDAAAALACLRDAVDRADLAAHFVDAPAEPWAALAGEKPAPRAPGDTATCPPATLSFHSEWPSQARIAARLQIAAKRRGLALTLAPLPEGAPAAPGLELATHLLPPDEVLATALLHAAHGPHVVPLVLEGVGVRTSPTRLRPVEFDAFGLPLLDDLERTDSP